MMGRVTIVEHPGPEAVFLFNVSGAKSITEYPSNPLTPIVEVWKLYRNYYATVRRKPMAAEERIWQAISQTMAILNKEE